MIYKIFVFFFVEEGLEQKLAFGLLLNTMMHYIDEQHLIVIVLLHNSSHIAATKKKQLVTPHRTTLTIKRLF